MIIIHYNCIYYDCIWLLLIFIIDEKRILSYKLKLLNINGYAQCALKNYSGKQKVYKLFLKYNNKKILNFNKYILGPFLNKEIVPDIVNIRSKQKKAYIDILELTLQNMLPSPSYYKMNINTKMGFLLGIYKNI